MDTVPCRLCRKVFYCNKKCLKRDSAYHEVECKVLHAIGDNDLPDEETRTVIRALAREEADKARGKPSVGHFFGCKRTTEDLLSHIEDLLEDEHEQAHTKAETIHELVKAFLNVSLEEVFVMMQKARINCHSLVDHNDCHFYSRGRAVYLGASKTNHSCVVNNDYIQMFDGRTILLRALTHIELDDPQSLTIHYMPPSLPYEERARRCLNNYYFICSCDKCVRQARIPEETPCSPEIAREVEQLFEDYHTTQEWYDMGSAILSKMNDLPDNNFYVYWLLIQLQPSADELEKYEESLNFAVRALKGAESILSLEPILNTMCNTMAKMGLSLIHI